MSAIGTWDVTIKLPIGPQETVLELREEAGQLCGTQSGGGQTNPISDPSIDGNALSWTSHITKPMKLTVKFSGEISGDRIEGKAKVGALMSYGFTASRRAA